MRCKALSHKHLRRSGGRGFDVNPYCITTYDEQPQQMVCRSIWHCICSSKTCAKYHENHRKYCQNLLTEKSGFFSCNLKYVLYNVDIRRKRKRETKMKNLKMEAVKVGFVLTKDARGFYHLYDVKMGYDVLVTAFRESVVRMIQDEKAMMEYNRRNRSPVVGA